MDCEVILQPKTALRGEKMLRSMLEAAEEAGVRCVVTDQWRRQAPWMMTYGLGHLGRRPYQEAHKRRGGRLIGWDLGYWNRDVPLAFNMRLTLDDDHPNRWLRKEPAGRFDSTGIQLRNDYDPSGPVVLVGLGKKQRALMGFQGQQWERQKFQELRRSGKRVVYRPKRPENLPGCETRMGEIDDAIRGASLVVCHHSNVAVDACIAGIPVECEAGAAFSLYRENANPSEEQRLEFLRSLAWWQWNPIEAVKAWEYIKERLT